MTTATTTPSRAAEVPAKPQAEGQKINIGRVIAWAVMIILILITLFPFYWMLRTALSTSKSLFSDPTSLLPVDFTWGAFKRVLGLSTAAEAQAEGGSGAAGTASPRRRCRGGDKLFFLFLTALMTPPIFVALPNFILIKNLGLLNTFPRLILPYFFMTPFAIFFLRQFFLGISREIEEAAKLDGARRL